MVLGFGKNEDFRLNLAKISTLDAGNINFLPMPLLMLIVNYEAFKNDNSLAQAILEASLVEALERRADAAFGVIRAEEERNQRFITRRDSILSRHFWTDTVEWWMKNHPEQVSDSYRRFVYSNVSDCLNRTMFGKTSRQLIEHYDLLLPLEDRY